MDEIYFLRSFQIRKDLMSDIGSLRDEKQSQSFSSTSCYIEMSELPGKLDYSLILFHLWVMLNLGLCFGLCRKRKCDSKNAGKTKLLCKSISVHKYFKS